MNLDKSIEGLPVDFHDIELSNKHETIYGKGMMFLNEKGRIELRLFPDNPKQFNIHDFVNEFNESYKKVGKIIGAEEYYTLKATSVDDVNYFCQRIYLCDHVNFRVFKGKVCSDLIIKNTEKTDSYKIAKIEIPYIIKLPYGHIIETQKKYSDKWTSKSLSRKIFQITMDEMSIVSFTKKNSTIILIQGTSQPQIENDIPKIILSLEFLTASLIDRYSTEYEYQGQFMRIFRYYNAQLAEIKKGYPPLVVSVGIKQDTYAQLFLNFYNFIKTHNHQAISRTLHRIISSRDSYITDYALTLTTSIETILRKYYSKDKPKTNKHDIDFIKSEIQNTSICETIKTRLLGMVSNIFGQERADDILRGLVKKELVERKMYSDWKTLRNSVNHGQDPSEDLNVYYRLCGTNLALYYRIIMTLISYHGTYTDYSKEGSD